jgi:hypothetical protein
MLLNTLKIRVTRPDGKVTLKERRVLRIVKDGGSLAGQLCVARHRKAILITGIVDCETVTVDMRAPRIDLTDTRVATPADLTGGMTVSAAA